MNRWLDGLLIAGLAALTIASIAPALAEGDPDYFVVGAGAFDLNDDQTTAEIDLQFRFNESFLYLHPHMGFFATADGSFYVYGGVLLDFHLTDSLVVSGSTAVGAYEQGDGKDLGGIVEFRSAVEIAYQFQDRSRLGLQIGHLSNAGIYKTNPGENFLILNFAIPTDVFSR